MSEEQLKQLNERLAKAEELLKEAIPMILFTHISCDKSEKSWLEKYEKYLQTYKK